VVDVDNYARFTNKQPYTSSPGCNSGLVGYGATGYLLQGACILNAGAWYLVVNAINNGVAVKWTTGATVCPWNSATNSYYCG
jgi:hypothetical protein